MQLVDILCHLPQHSRTFRFLCFIVVNHILRCRTLTTWSKVVSWCQHSLIDKNRHLSSFFIYVHIKKLFFQKIKIQHSTKLIHENARTFTSIDKRHWTIPKQTYSTENNYQNEQRKHTSHITFINLRGNCTCQKNIKCFQNITVPIYINCICRLTLLWDTLCSLPIFEEINYFATLILAKRK